MGIDIVHDRFREKVGRRVSARNQVSYLRTGDVNEIPFQEKSIIGYLVRAPIPWIYDDLGLLPDRIRFAP